MKHSVVVDSRIEFKLVLADDVFCCTHRRSSPEWELHRNAEAQDGKKLSLRLHLITHWFNLHLLWPLVM